jgi:uncharacterized protein YicC (UPF0701 family)
MTSTSPVSAIPVEWLLAALAGLMGILFALIKVLGREWKEKATTLETKLEAVAKDVATLKASAPQQLADRITKLESDLNELRVKVAEELITKEEFREFIGDIKNQIRGLKEDISSVDDINREQAQVLARIEAMMQSLLS